MADYRQFHICGTHADLGHRLGLEDGSFARQSWWAPGPEAYFASECLRVVRDVHPALVDEHHAYADAQKINVAAFWRDCCRVDLRARMTQRHAQMTGSAEGCSTVAFTTNRGLAVGRNYDYWHHQVRRQRIRFKGTRVFGHTGARGSVPCGRYDGLNERGLFFSLHVVLTQPATEGQIKPGVPFHLIGRIVLELCASVSDALDLLLALPHLSSLNYLVADVDTAIVVEADPRRVRVRHYEGAPLAVTNHFRHLEMQPLQGARGRTVCRRYEYLAGSCMTHSGDGDGEDVVAFASRLLADRTAPICGIDGALQTLWSCIALPGDRRIWYCPGAPATTQFSEVPLP